MSRKILLVFAIASALYAQTPTGELTGSVVDPAGAGIAAATITVTNTGTDVTRVSSSNEVGRYTIPALLKASSRLNSTCKSAR